jgi:hypothetical protein
MPTPAQLATLIEKLQSDTNAASVAPKITKVSRKRYQAKVSDTGKIEVSEELKQEIFKSNE